MTLPSLGAGCSCWFSCIPTSPAPNLNRTVNGSDIVPCCGTGVNPIGVVVLQSAKIRQSTTVDVRRSLPGSEAGVSPRCARSVSEISEAPCMVVRVNSGLIGKCSLESVCATKRHPRDFSNRSLLAYKGALVVVTLVCVCWSTLAECICGTYTKLALAKKPEQSTSIPFATESEVWTNIAPLWAIAFYEVKSLANSLSVSAVVIYVHVLSLGVCVVPRREFVTFVTFAGVSSWGFQVAARHAGNIRLPATSAILETLSYVLAYVGWFMPLSISHPNLTKRLARGPLFPLVLLNIVCTLVAVILDRVLGFRQVWPKLILLILKSLEVLVALVCVHFHSIASCFAIMSYFTIYPLSLSWAFRQLIDTWELTSTTTAILISSFSLVCALYLKILAGGAVTPHQATLIIFPMQLLEHLWTKSLLARTLLFSPDFFGTSIAQYASVFLIRTQHGRQIMRRLLRPVLTRSPILRLVLAELLVIDQPAWKAVLLVEHKAFLASHGCAADLLATLAVGLLTAQQWLLEATGFADPAFNVGQRMNGSKMLFAVAWVYLLLLSAVVSFVSSATTVSYLTHLQDQYFRIRESSPTAKEVAPLAGINAIPLGRPKRLSTFDERDFHTLRCMDENLRIEQSEGCEDGEDKTRDHVSSPQSVPHGSSSNARSSSCESSKSNVGDCGHWDHLPSRVFPQKSTILSHNAWSRLHESLMRFMSDSTRLESYLQQAVSEEYYERFEAFTITAEAPALLLEKNVEANSLHNICIVRYFGFFAVASVYIVTQMLYQLSAAELVSE
eukprot:TRINITY_DN68095_c0_g1_i1.p1 TRINITY_DN68095_c0_g1~~TRINITY_DN68095_c0_g1_i1.p1  ORF type:complete len:785 (+),score=61.25 TRINITY_DN68095_c0_g1_i1:56-2410(+)